MVVVQHVQYCILWSHSALQVKMVFCNVMPFGLLSSYWWFWWACCLGNW